MARLWASRFSKGGFCIGYEIDLQGLNICRLDNNTNEDALNWISILVKHRFSKSDYEANEKTINWLVNNYCKDLSLYDLIVGYRADDSYFAYSRDFVKNELSIEALLKAMIAGKLGLQYVLKSEKAFSKIKMKSYEEVSPSDLYSRFRQQTINEYHIIKDNDQINNTFIRDIMRLDNK